MLLLIMSNAPSEISSFNFFTDMLIPGFIGLIVAIFSYWAADRLGEYKKRKQFSKLGIAVLESLDEEITNGFLQLRTFQDDFKSNVPKNSLISLPNNSWNGMSTISDDILLRIIEVSKNYISNPFHLKDIRIHCKNYFVNICNNSIVEINRVCLITKSKRKLTKNEYSLFNENILYFINRTQEVHRLVTDAIKLLEENTNKKIPK